jgi:hypothetical protein
MNYTMLNLLQIKKKANIPDVHYDSILKELYQSNIIKEELQTQCPYSTEEAYLKIGLDSDIGDFKAFKCCLNRCVVFEEPRERQIHCPVCRTSRLGIDSDLVFFCRPIKSIFLRFWKKKKFRECFNRNNPKHFEMDNETPILGFNSGCMSLKMANVFFDTYIHTYIHT